MVEVLTQSCCCLSKKKRFYLKITAISDTHGRHNRLKLAQGDMLIHAGDVSMTGARTEIRDFLYWFGQQPFTYKIFIAGNHDFFFEKAPDQEILAMIPPGIIYLNDSGVTIGGLSIWGSPITPWFFDWAFNRQRGKPIKQHWDLIPPGTDILVTHGPVFRILDTTIKGDHVGCQDLSDTVHTIRPAAHICGHIHEAYGRIDRSGTTFINASVLDEKYNLANSPVELQLPFSS